ncbi:putative fasciclin-like arabinogalactan protein 20 [Amaranthus tricolor]|uniref:putative fasciclin-like arabinogalactan protein 20 n=1 Tax=Amaranthus tricolor TaxID=29722 RepID=UPI00258F8CD6|nr:putative fasciclin-like arabinogalactan protein 20 [Amaranthus tricolor]
MAIHISMASISFLLLFLTFSLLLPLSSSISEETIKNAAEILSNSGFHSMSLTLSLLSQSLLSSLPSSTLFTPSDSSFSLSSFTSGQPSLSLLQFHFCPRFYSFADLQSLSYASKIPTLLFNNGLIITSSTFDDDVFINGVKINGSPVYDDGFFVIYEIDQFFTPNFTIEFTLSPTPITPQCSNFTRGNGSYLEASQALRSKGYSLMAAFLDLQLTEFGDNKQIITIFSPNDAAMKGQLGNYSEWGSVFLRYIVGCELNWADLIGFNDGIVLNTFLEGFQINVSRSIDEINSGFSLMINRQVWVEFPELYRNDKIVVHGLSGALVMAEKFDEERLGVAYSPVDHVEF